MNPSPGVPPRSRTVNVVITSRLEPRFQQQIAAVNPDLKLADACDLISAELRRAPSGGLPPEKRQALDECLSTAEVVLAQMPPRDLLRRAPSLRWLHLVSAGADRLAGTGILESGVTATNSSGIHRDTISEFVLTMMLMLAKEAPACFQRQQNRQWKRFVPGELKGKTLGIVGLGRIGQGVARLGKTLGMRVVATRRSAARRESDVMGVDALYPPAQLCEMLSQSDYVVLLVPLTPETIRLIGEAELKAMKPTAYLINVCRGPVVDELSLVRALKEGWISGAGLDVFEKEPLPAGSELWTLPNVIVTPHIAGESLSYNERMTALFCDNLTRYLSGQPLMNVVDREKGY